MKLLVMIVAVPVIAAFEIAATIRLRWLGWPWREAFDWARDRYNVKDRGYYR